MSECGVCPQYTLGCNAFSCLAHVHRNGGAEEVLDLVAVRIRRNPAGASQGSTSENEGREVDESDIVEVGGEEPGHVLLEA